MLYVGLKFTIAEIIYLATPIRLDFRVTFIYLFSLYNIYTYFHYLIMQIKSVIIDNIHYINSSCLILVLCFSKKISWFALLKLGCILYTFKYGTCCSINIVLWICSCALEINTLKDFFIHLRHGVLEMNVLVWRLYVSVQNKWSDRMG